MSKLDSRLVKSTRNRLAGQAMPARRLASRLLEHVPRYVEARWTLRDAQARRRGADPWTLRSFGPVLDTWLDDLHSARRLATRTPRRILCFAYLPYWVEICVATSVALCGHDCQVDVAWLDEFQDFACPESRWKVELRDNRFRFAHAFRRHSAPPLRFMILSETPPSQLTEEMVQAARKQSIIDTAYSTTKESLDILGDDRAVFERRQHRNLDCMARVLTIIRRGNYDSLLLPSGAVIEFGAVYRLAQLLGLPTTTFEFWGRPERVNVSQDSPVVHVELSSLWETDAPHVLSDERRARVQKILDGREVPPEGGRSSAHQHTGPAATEQLRSQLHLAQGKPLVLLCPNVPFDAVFLVSRNALFPTMSEWLVETVRHLMRHPEAEVVVRGHPGELVWAPDQTAESILRQHGLLNAGNIHWVAPSDPVNTYSLMRLADVGIVHSSTTAMEMPLFGVPVVCGNTFHYNRKGFTIEPETRDEYFQCIDRMLARPERLTARQVELACCYVDIFFNQWPRPFPWVIGRLRQGLSVWPMGRVLSEEGQAQFGATFDYLARR